MKVTDISSYPRPQLRRDSYLSLDGVWDFSVSKRKEFPEEYKSRIIVPYPPQSPMSGIGTGIEDASYLFYRRCFKLDKDFLDARVILNIGAADQVCDVYVNSNHVLSHEGGYHSFCADITDHLKDENEICIRTYDDLRNKSFPYGKQKQKRGGMWYTPVSGIWQSIWLESVPERHIKSIDISTREHTATIRAQGCCTGDKIKVYTPDGQLNAIFENDTVSINLTEPCFWSPENPYLYNVEITAGSDTVYSYFALRTLDIKTVNGIKRLCLNGEPYFFNGVLDQGYWPEGIYTPPSAQSFANDILSMKSLGFNTLRKHIKTEPEQFYYECDKLGMIVFQDMVNNGSYSFIKDTALPTIGFKKKKDKHSNSDALVRKRFMESMAATVKQLKNHPCICMWTIFNEGWGQFDADICTDELKKLDNTRFIDSTSGWFKQNSSDVESIHTYFRKFKAPKSDKAMILSEFGGYACSIEGHRFDPNKEYGYRTYKSTQEFEEAICRLYETEIIPAVSKGLCAAILTQISDVEDETNGLLTYDRQLCKVSASRMRNISEKLSKQIKN